MRKKDTRVNFVSWKFYILTYSKLFCSWLRYHYNDSVYAPLFFYGNFIFFEETFDELYVKNLNVSLFEGTDAFPSQIIMMKIGEMAKPSSTTQQTGRLIFLLSVLYRPISFFNCSSES